MELELNINETINKIKEQTLELDADRRIDILKSDLQSISQNAIEKTMNYIIKSMPIPDAMKDVLRDVKEAVKTKNLKHIIGTAISSSVREGLEIKGVSKSTINSLNDVKELAVKGGLLFLLKNGVDIVERNYLNKNIVGDYVYSFFNKVKEYILSKNFIEKIDAMVNRPSNKKDEYLNKCEKWYEAYQEMDIKRINKISEELDTNKYIINRYEDCKKENSIIQNMTKMINSKKGFLSKEQQMLCEAI